jgi:hypothetical protein
MIPKKGAVTAPCAPVFVVDGVEYLSPTACCDILIDQGVRSAHAYQLLANSARAGRVRTVSAGRVRVYHAEDVQALAESRRP